MSSLPPELQALSSIEKKELARLLLESVHEDESVLTEAQIQELDRRIEKERDNSSIGIRWDDLMVELLGRRHA